MSASARPAAGSPRRSKAYAYLLLARVSNLPTVWTNVLAAYACVAAPLDSIAIAIASLSLFYTAGMFLNDVCDVRVDARERSDRPIPNGDVGRAEAIAITIALFVAAEMLLWRQPHASSAMAWGLVLMAAITAYDLSHKGKWYGPIVMGACRALVYVVAASSVAGSVPAPVFIAAAVMWLYVIGLTWVAKAANLGHAVPWMLAGICLVDAAIIAWRGEPQLALIAVAAFPVTRALQRVVPGT